MDTLMHRIMHVNVAAWKDVFGRPTYCISVLVDHRSHVNVMQGDLVENTDRVPRDEVAHAIAGPVGHHDAVTRVDIRQDGGDVVVGMQTECLAIHDWPPLDATEPERLA